MFIVNKEGTLIEEIHKLYTSCDYSDKAKKEADEIYNNAIKSMMRFPVMEAIEESARKYAENYLAEQKREYRIFINDGVLIGKYDEEHGKVIFGYILTAMKNGDKLFDVRECANANKE